MLVISYVDSARQTIITLRPPFAVGGAGDILGVIKHNGLVLALHAMACVAGFIAGSSLPLQAQHRAGFHIIEVPITFRDRQHGKSKMSWRIAAEAIWLVPLLRFRKTPAPADR